MKGLATGHMGMQKDIGMELPKVWQSVSAKNPPWFFVLFCFHACIVDIENIHFGTVSGEVRNQKSFS